MDHVLARHRKPHGIAYRHMQHIDFRLPIGMLELPHPLLGDDADRQRAFGREIDGKEYLRGQYKKAPDQQERDDRPGRLEPDLAIGRMIAIDLLAPQVQTCQREDSTEHWPRAWKRAQ